MSEASDRPSPTPSATHIRTSAPAPMPAAPSTPNPEPAVYGSLCLTAVIGFGAGALYSGFIVLAAIVAFWGGTPLLMPGWSLLFPALGAGISWLATGQIARSEGTLAGAKLARWGLLLSVFAGLTYWAYYGATYIAIQKQADDFVQKQYFRRLMDGKIDGAFMQTLRPVDRRPEDGNERTELEIRHNPANETGMPGPLSGYYSSDMVRLLSQAGPSPQIESRGASEWGFAEGGYQVTLDYRIHTELAGFDLTITVQGNESKHGEYKGREWHVLMARTGVTRDGYRMMTPAGERAMTCAMQAQRVGEHWMQLIQTGHHDEAYLLTLSPEDRERALKTLPKPLSGGNIGFFLLTGLPIGASGRGNTPAESFTLATLASQRETLRDYSEALAHAYFPKTYLDYRKNSVVRADPKLFWAPTARLREEMTQLMRKASTEFEPATMSWRMTPAMVPVVRTVGDRYQVEHDISMRDSKSRQMVEARLVLECAASAPVEVTAKQDAWRVVSIDLLRVKSMPMPGEGPGSVSVGR